MHGLLAESMESGSQFSHYGMGYWQRAWSQAPSLVIMAWVIGREHGVRLALQLLWHGLLAESMESGSQFSHYGMGYWQRAWSQAPSLVIMAWVIGREHGGRLALQSLWHGLLAESMESGSQFSHYGMGYWQRAWSQAPSLIIMAWVIGREHGVRLPV